MLLVDTLTARLVRPAAAAAGVALVTAAWAGPLLNPAELPANTPLALLLTGFAAAALLLAWWAPRLPVTWSPMVLFALLAAGFVAVGAGIMSPAASPWDVAYLPLVMVAVGSLQLHTGWFVANVAVGWAVAAAAVIAGGWVSDGRAGVGWAVVLVVATLLSVLALTTRQRLSRMLVREWQEASEEAARDALTGLLNRRGLMASAQTKVSSELGADGSVTVSFCDVDGLKQVNDTYGHDAGDALLAAVASALQRSVRGQDWVARWGGDEFVVVSVGSGVPPQVLASRVRDALAAAPPPPEVPDWNPQVSIGQVCVHAGQQATLADLIEAADADMYATRCRRRAGRG